MIRSTSKLPGSISHRFWSASLFLFVFAFIFALAAFGQGDRGTITGTVSDPSGGVAPNASIDVKNVDTGAVFHGGTSATGNYVIPVPTGTYEVTVTVPGFKKYVREKVEVRVASDTREDVKLVLGAVTETVTVTNPLLFSRPRAAKSATPC